MPKSKDKMEDALRELLVEKNYHEITVNDIVERCGVHRNTFYYNYRDVPQLLNEMIRHVMSDLVQNVCTYDTPEGWIEPMIEYVQSSRDAILHLYHSTEQDTLKHYLREYTNYAVWEYVRAVTSGKRMREHEMEMLTCYYSSGLRGVLFQWLDRGLIDDYVSSLRALSSLYDRQDIEKFLQAYTNEL